MRGKVVMVNSSSRLAAAEIKKDQYLVFEYHGVDHFNVDEIIDNLQEKYGIIICKREGLKSKTAINVLSSSVSYAQAKLVIAPWQDVGIHIEDSEETNIS